MIRVAVAKEPAYFDAEIRKPGNDWLAGNPDKERPRDFWSRCLSDLEEAFASRCGYAAMLDPTGGTVDHYRSFRNNPELAYEWSNYRFASAPMNSSKKNADSNVLDPYEIADGWFEILLPSLQMRVTDAIPEQHRARAQYTLQRLKLRDGERVIRWREGWYEMYRNGELTLAGLRRVAPLIAEAVVREGEE